jgi:hypothetical protein
MRLLLNISILTVAVYCGLVLLLYLFQRNLLYHPSTKNSKPADYGISEMSLVEIITSDGLKLDAWFKEAEEGKKTILYLHGNAGHLGHRSIKVKKYLDAGFGLLLLGYRGYGGNSGKPSEKKLYIDGRAALHFLIKYQVPLSKTIIYGESLGTGVAVEIARNLQINCLVLEAPFSSMTDVATHHFFYLPTRFLLKDHYNSIGKINEIIAPIFFVHGEMDTVVPWEFGKRLYDAAPQPKELLLIENANHNNLYEFGASNAIIKFIERINK